MQDLVQHPPGGPLRKPGNSIYLAPLEFAADQRFLQQRGALGLRMRAPSTLGENQAIRGEFDPDAGIGDRHYPASEITAGG